jgi:hypothetical protein
MLKKINIIAVTTLLLFMSFQGHAELSSAQVDADMWDAIQAAQKAVKESPRSMCYETLTISYDLELAYFFLFLEGHFLNKSANTSLTNIAISRFLEYKTRVESLYTLAIDYKVGTAIAPRGIIEEAAPLLACIQLRDEYIEMGKQKMIEHIQNNQAQKRSMMIVEKYKSINSGLRDMNLEVAKIYGAFMTFNAKLPWFSKQCIVN